MAEYTEIDIAGLEGNEASQPRVFAHSATPLTGSNLVDGTVGQTVVTTGTPGDKVSVLNRGACLYVGIASDVTVVMEGQPNDTAFADAITFHGVTAGSFLPVLVTKVYKVGKTDGTNYTAGDIDKRVIALF